MADPQAVTGIDAALSYVVSSELGIGSCNSRKATLIMIQPFSLDPSMTALLGGAFYPTGYAFVMFPNPRDALAVGERLASDGQPAEEIFFLAPEVVLSQITPTVSGADDPLPSAGTEGATIRAYTKLAREGHAALLVKAGDEQASERLMDAVRTVPYSIAQRYRLLVIEDL